MYFDLDFIAKLYNNRNSYADVFSTAELRALHVESGIETLLKKYIEQKKLIFLTGNPGDGKTHLIKSLKSFLDEHNAYVEPDANSIKDEEAFLTELRKAVSDGKPCIVAINEFPLISLIEKIGDRLPGFQQIMMQRDKGIIYNKGGEETIKDVVVVDLNNRNLLSRDMLEKTLNKLLEISKPCENCKRCSASMNLIKLKHPVVQQRLFSLIEKIGSIGLHVVMRDILGFFAFIITSGKKCVIRKNEVSDEGDYYNLIFNGSNELFTALAIFDPFHYSHPEIDERLWNGTLTEGWLFEDKYAAPEYSEEPLEAFKALKRRFYFENERGDELLELLPTEYKAYYDVLLQGYDRQDEMIKKIISGINKFFNPDDNEDDKLKMWTTHKYELRTYPRVAVSSKYAYSNQIELLVPRLPGHLKEMEYVPDHFLFRVYKSKEKAFVELRIDLNLYRILTLVQIGYPSQLVPEQHQFKLFRFMNELSSLESASRANEFLIRDMDNRSLYRVKVSNAQYVSKRG
ncbi:MAG: hypothetical protein E6Y08_00325 [Paenibacillus sp.]|uniref:hypothetical protein n=1 Tax=Paenibacillus sp. TaxID=58172 RepID=UPI00291165B8|nr:hypothetical protein [Paenibacillus sp.]MDU4694232.1 hypothetical protein [Paenibacillus sp.]